MPLTFVLHNVLHRCRLGGVKAICTISAWIRHWNQHEIRINFLYYCLQDMLMELPKMESAGLCPSWRTASVRQVNSLELKYSVHTGYATAHAVVLYVGRLQNVWSGQRIAYIINWTSIVPWISIYFASEGVVTVNSQRQSIFIYIFMHARCALSQFDRRRTVDLYNVATREYLCKFM